MENKYILHMSFCLQFFFYYYFGLFEFNLFIYIITRFLQAFFRNFGTIKVRGNVIK